jgi:hypothetical protein
LTDAVPGTTCRLQAHADLAVLTEKELIALLRVLTFLGGL